MYELPRNRPAVRRKWIKFIQFKRADFLATHPYPPNPSQPTTCTFLPSSRNCRPSSVIHLTVMHLTHRWPPNSLCAPRAQPTASEVTICLQVACNSGTQDPVLWIALITHLLAFWQARGYATDKRGPQRESRFGLAVRRSRIKGHGSISLRLSFFFKKAAVCGHCLVTLSSQLMKH